MASLPGDNGQLGGATTSIVPYGGGAPGAGAAASGGLGTFGPPTKDCQGICSIYCPQSCYYFAPPPPFDYFADGSGGDSSGQTFSPLVIAIIGILGSAFLLIAYYTIISKYCARIDSLHFSSSRRQRRRDHVTTPLTDADDDGPGGAHHLRHLHGPDGWQNAALVSEGLDEAVIRSISVCRYRKGDGFVDGTDCPVCLTEFHDDEALRLLPKCGHAFHVACIDTWLKSHSNCPLCRANIAPIPLPMSPPAPVRVGMPPPPRQQQSQAQGQLGPRDALPTRVPSSRANFTAVAVEDLMATDRGGSGRGEGFGVHGTNAAAASIKDNTRGNASNTAIRGIPTIPASQIRGGGDAVVYEIGDDVVGAHSSRRRDHHRVLSIGEVLETDDDDASAAAGSTSSGRRMMAHHSNYHGTSRVLHCVMNSPVGRLYFGGTTNNNNRHNGNDNNNSFRLPQ